MLPRPPWRSMLKPYAASISLLTPISPSPPPFPHISHLPAQRAEPTAWAKPAGKPCTKRADASTSSNYCLTQHSPEVLSSPKKRKKEKKIKLPKGVSAPQDRLGGKPAPQAPSSDSFSYSSNAGCSQHPSSLLRFSFGQRKHCRWQQCRPPYVSPIPNLSLKHQYFRAGRICLKSCMQSTAWTTAPIPTSSWNANPAANPSTKTTPSFREKGLEKAKRVRESKKLPSETTYAQ